MGIQEFAKFCMWLGDIAMLQNSVMWPVDVATNPANGRYFELNYLWIGKISSVSDGMMRCAALDSRQCVLTFPCTGSNTKGVYNPRRVSSSLSKHSAGFNSVCCRLTGVALFSPSSGTCHKKELTIEFPSACESNVMLVSYEFVNVSRAFRQARLGTSWIHR